MRLAAVLVVVLVLGVASAVAARAVLHSEHAALHPQLLATTSTVGPPGPGPTTIRAGSPAGSSSIDVARAAACTAERRALDAAEEQYRLLEGGYADAAALVAAHSLREAPTHYRISSTDGWQTYRLQPVPPCG